MAHLALIWAYTSISGFTFNVIPLVVLVPVCGAILAFLWKGLGRYRFPVVVYLLAIMTMCWQAVSLFRQINTTAFLCISAGSLLFFLSDTLFAIDRFRKSFRTAQVFILSAYWTALYLITISGWLM